MLNSQELAVFLLISLVASNGLIYASELASSYQYSRVLVEPDVVKMYWSNQMTSSQSSSSSNRLDIEIQVKNSDWMIFCLNYPTSSSQSSLLNDCVVSGLSNETGIGHFSDRFLNNQRSASNRFNQLTGKLIKDNKRDFDPLNVYYDGSYLIYKFTRPIKRCDESGQDLDIESGMTSISFAYGTNGTQIATNDNITISNDNVYYSSKSNMNEIAAKMKSMNVELIPVTESQARAKLSCPLAKTVPIFESQPTENYKNSVELVPGIYKFFWDIRGDELYGEVHCRTNGWVGFGLTPNGQMEESDVFIGWIKDGKTDFTDRHITKDKQVVVDAQQDWHLISSSESNGFTIFKFKRLLRTCDPQDRDVEEGSPKVIYAWGTGDILGYHGYNQRGVRDVYLIDHELVKAAETMPSDVEKLVFRIENVIIPTADTYYYNEVVQIPKLNEKHHIVKWELEFSDFHFENMHHMVYYECSGYNGTPAILPGDSTQARRFDQYCSTASFAWAVGAKQYGLYPQNTGVPIGGKDIDYNYLRLEIHYDNPALTFGFIDRVDVIYYITKQLREHDLGTFSTGSLFDALAIAIPPGETEYTVTANCYNPCIRSLLSQQNMNIIMAFPHTHLAGLEVSTDLIRKGKNIGPVFRNKYYRFDFQQTYVLNEPVVVTPEDEFITKCIYQTKDSKDFIYGGLGTNNEMCLHFFTYYPRIPNFYGCYSQPSYQEAYEMMLQLNKTGDVDLKGVADDVNSVLIAGYQTINPKSANARNSIKKFNYNHKNYMVCGKPEDSEYSSTREEIKPSNVYVEPDYCAAKTSVMHKTISYIKSFFGSK